MYIIIINIFTGPLSIRALRVVKYISQVFDASLRLTWCAVNEAKILLPFQIISLCSITVAWLASYFIYEHPGLIWVKYIAKVDIAYKDKGEYKYEYNQ